MAQSAFQVCTAYWFAGDVAKIVDIGSKAIHLLEENHLEKDFFGMGFSPYSAICTFYGHSLAWMGRFKEGTDVLEKGFRNACEVNDKFVMGFTQVLSLLRNAHWQDTGIVQSRMHRKPLKFLRRQKFLLALMLPGLSSGEVIISVESMKKR